MKKKVLMGIVLLALIGTSAVFAQQPTLDKLKFWNNTDKVCEAQAANQQIRGEVVIPAVSPSGRTVMSVSSFRNCTGVTNVVFPDSGTTIGIHVGTFSNCTGLTSITLPANVNNIGSRAFEGCTNLTSVTFKGEFGWSQGQTGIQNSADVFPGDLRAKYVAGGPGTYTRPAGSNTWTKAPAVNTSLEGSWRRQPTGNEIITIRGDTAVLDYYNPTSALGKSSVEKGYFKVGTQVYRNLRSTGNLTWSGQNLGVTNNTSNPDVATGTVWRNLIITMDPGGDTFTDNDGVKYIRAGIQ